MIKKQLKEERIYFNLWLQGIDQVHRSGEGMATEAGSREITFHLIKEADSWNRKWVSPQTHPQ